MIFDLDEEQQAFVDTVREFAARDIAPGATDRDRAGEWFAEGWRKMGDLGLLGLQFPEEYGGSAAPILTTAAAFQAFTAGGADAGIALSWIAHSVLAGTPLLQFGSSEQKERYLRPVATGQVVAGYGLTEPGAGSDAAALQTSARREGDRWYLNGSKMFITNAPVGDVFVVFASTDRTQRSHGITAFVVERSFSGFKSGPALDKMGNRTSPTGELFFEECEVPDANVLGELGHGFAIAKAALEWERFLMMAHSVGTMQAILGDCLRYSSERCQFGRPIAEQPAIKVKLAGMAVDIAAAEAFVRRVAWLKDQSKPTPLESSACKIFTSAAVMRTALQGVQVHGGYGYIREFAVERNMRDAKLAEIGGGTSEIQRQVVGRTLLAAADQTWDLAYTSEQVAAREKAPTQANDLVGACLALAAAARRDCVAAIGLLAQAAVTWSLPPGHAAAGAPATFLLHGGLALCADSAQILLTGDRLLVKPDWSATAQTGGLLGDVGLAQVSWGAAGEAVDSRLGLIGRLFVGAIASGQAEAALDEALAVVAEQGGDEPDQLTEFKLADMRTQVDGARLLVLRAALRVDSGQAAAESACLEARLFAAAAAAGCVHNAAELCGLGASKSLQRLITAAHLPALLGPSLDSDQQRLAVLLKQ
ncbi:MAG: acyl-CoA dehydrogenase family protein [Chloroflexi bacterium]|nr:acyl-CoA dehydrogenase family protein [Chloroflexota bacterium]